MTSNATFLIGFQVWNGFSGRWHRGASPARAVSRSPASDSEPRRPGGRRVTVGPGDLRVRVRYVTVYPPAGRSGPFKFQVAFESEFESESPRVIMASDRLGVRAVLLCQSR